MAENILNTGIGITPGFPGAQTETLTRAQRLERRAALDAGDVERALVGIIAESSGLETDAALFRHDHPTDILDAALVRLTGETADASPDHRSFKALFSGRETTPGAILPGALKLLGTLPLKWLTAAGGALGAPVVVAEVKLLRPATFGRAFSNGRETDVFEAELGVRVCTSLPRGGATS